MGLLNASVPVARPHSSESGKLRVLLDFPHPPLCRDGPAQSPSRSAGSLASICASWSPIVSATTTAAAPPSIPPIDDSFQLEIGKVRWPFTKLFKRYYHHYPNLRKTIEDFQPHIIDIWEEPWGLVSAQVCSLRRRFFPSIKLISETEQNLARRYPPPFETLRRYTLKRADFVIARSSEAFSPRAKKRFHRPRRSRPQRRRRRPLPPHGSL